MPTALNPDPGYLSGLEIVAPQAHFSTFFFHQPLTFMGLFLSALGLMMIFEGIPYFCSPSQVKNFAQKIGEIPDRILRILGFALMLLGLTVVYFGRTLFENS